MNVLIIGLGSIARKHINALKLLDFDLNIFALRSKLNSDLIEGVVNIYSLEDIDVNFDFSIISNPTILHYDTIQFLVKKKIPLFIEKPPLHSLKNSEKLINLIEHSGLLNYVACNIRFHPCLQFLKEFISSKKKYINEVNVYCGSYLPDWRPNVNFREVYSVNPEMGGGVHLDLFHEVDYIYWLFGMPQKKNSILRSVSSLNIESIDYANYILEYSTFSVSIILNYYRKVPKRLIEIVFVDEILTVDLLKNQIKNGNQDVIFEDNKFSMFETYVKQFIFFLEALKKKDTVQNSFKDSIEVLKIVLCNER